MGKAKSGKSCQDCRPMKGIRTTEKPSQRKGRKAREVPIKEGSRHAQAAADHKGTLIAAMSSLG